MRIYLLTLILFTLTACTLRLVPAPASTQIPLPIPSPVEVHPIFSLPQGDVTHIPQSNLTPSPELEKLLKIAKMDLALRLSIPDAKIILVDTQEVVWSDSSLGCPNPSLMYTQVLTPGYLIRLQALDQEFEFHANKTNSVVYCPNPSPPLPDTLQSE